MSDFSYLPDFVFEETLEYKTLISEFENAALNNADANGLRH